jgi:sugar phosphate isomerase/epimerase
LNRITLTGFTDEITPDFQTQLETAAALGLRYIEIRGVNGRSIVGYTPDEARELKNLLLKHGIGVSAIGSPCGKINIGDDFEPHFKMFQNTAALCEILDTRYIRVFSFFLPPGADPAQYRAPVLDRLGRMVEYAAKQDLILLHENEKDIYGDKAVRCVDMLRHFNSPHFRGIFDFANFIQCKQDTLEAYETLRPFIDYIHIKDARWADGRVTPAGMGDGRVAELLKRFQADGYSGYLSLEPHLGNFVGFRALESQSGGGEEPVMDGRETFKLALNALKSILWDLNWR